MIKIKMLKDTEKCKAGEIVSSTKENAESTISQGYAEYVTENKSKKKELSPKDKKGYAKAYKILEKEGAIENNNGVVKDFLISIGVNKRTLKEEFKVDIDKVAEHLLEKHKFATWFGVKSDYSFNWDGQIYKKDSRGIIKVDCEEILGVFCKRNLVDEIFEKIKRKSKVDREEFEINDPDFIPLENGIWDIPNKKLIPHNPEYKFQFVIPHSYKKEATCEKWLKFLKETLYSEDIEIMQEWFGFLLYREYFIKKGIICEGPQNTGKSVLLDTVIKFVGEKNKTGLSLQKITRGSDFTKLSLKNKHANVYDDLSSKDLDDGGAFKVATGGGYISGEEKFGEFSQFRSFAKQMFATNKIPPVKDNDDLAYYGRWIPIKFHNVPERIDPFLRRKLWEAEEMSGILNWALQGLYRILESGKFSHEKPAEEIKNIMEMSGCPLVAFSLDVLEKSNGSIVSKADMFGVYSAWCEKENKPRLSKEMLGRQLDKYCNYILPEKHKERIWKNAKIKENWVGFTKNQEISSNVDSTDTSLKHICSENKHTKECINMVDIIFGEVSEELPKNTCKRCSNIATKEINSVPLCEKCFKILEKDQK